MKNFIYLFRSDIIKTGNWSFTRGIQGNNGASLLRSKTGYRIGNRNYYLHDNKCW